MTMDFGKVPRQSPQEDGSPRLSRSLLTRREVIKGAVAGSALLGLGGFAAACSGEQAEEPAPARKGGRLRVGITGGSAKDTLEAQNPVTQVDTARAEQLYERLASFDPQFEIQLDLAEEIEPNATGDEWTIRVHPDVTFHDGKTLTADDVIFSLQRILDPDDPKIGASGLNVVDPEDMEKLDERTVRLKLTEPNALLLDELAQRWNVIVPEGYETKSAIGTGPFKAESFTPGQQSVFVRNENYWRDGQPYVDKVEIIDFPDESARVNALLGGQVDAIDSLPFGQIAVIEGNDGLRTLVSETGGWVPFTMRADTEPFTDVRVREAFRLIVDREQMVQQALAGQGRIANDLYAPFDPCYASDIPQREQDIEKARSLLKEAGKEGLEVTLNTAPAAQGMLESGQIFVEQAKAAGVTVRLRRYDAGEFYGDEYLQYVFAQDYWYTRNYIPQAFQADWRKAPYNETHFNDPEFDRLVEEARRTVDETKRCELLHEAQMIQWTRGGYINWGFRNIVDAYSAKVEGFEPDRSGAALTTYRFKQVSFS